MMNFSTFYTLNEDTTKSLKSRFSGKIDKKGGHWYWKGHVSKVTKQPQMWVNGKVHPANRVAWMLFKGKVPTPGRVIRHTCGVKNCVNPAHLSISNNKSILSVSSED
jgi:hypothetical protein